MQIYDEGRHFSPYVIAYDIGMLNVALVKLLIEINNYSV